MNRKIVYLVVLLVAGIALVAGDTATGDDADPVTLHRMAATVATHTYNRAHPPAQMPATQPDEAGVTVSEFSCVAEVRGQVIDQADAINGTAASATVRMASIHITLKLKIDEWMDQLAPQKIWSHEDGHRDIALFFYRHADQTAEQVARAWVDKTLTATGADAASAAKKALTDAAQKITDGYMEEVRDQSELVQEAYDRITAHGTNDVDEYDAIQDALAEVAKAHPKN
jgi:hypothetical protein